MSHDIDSEKLKQFIEKADNLKKKNKLDLSSDQDLSIAVMNLISIEEHFFFSGVKLKQTKYFDLLEEVREIRKSLLKKLVKDPEGEEWCISKHLLSSSMRLMEVGTKQLSMNNKEEAYDLFQKSYELYSMFWGINLKVIDTKDISKIPDNALSKRDKKPTGFMDKMQDLVKKVIDCCIE